MEEKTKKKKNSKNNVYWIACILFCLGLSIVATALVNLMNGTETTSGKYPDDVKDISLVCENTGLAYPFFVYDNSVRKETKITALFRGEETPKDLSLIHSLFYTNEASVIGSEAHNHGAMNKKFATDSLGSDSFSAIYSKSEEKMQMTLFATSADLKKETTLKYFFLDSGGEFPKTKTAYEKILAEKGFSCRTEE